jgi:soluble lytic murein transglycosylase-like protein
MWIGSLLTAAALQGAEPPSAPRRVSVVQSDPQTGKLVRSVVVSPRTVSERTVQQTVIAPRVIAASLPAPAPTETEQPAGIDQAVEQIAAQTSLPADLIHSVIKVESNYNPYAVSSKGAQGLMQLIPATARRFGVDNVFNPIENIQGGARYLAYLLTLYKGNYPLALAAYNAGEAAVAKYGGVPPYRETQNYVELVGKHLAKRTAAAPKQLAPAHQETPRDPNAPARIREVVETDGTVRYVSQ